MPPRTRKTPPGAPPGLPRVELATALPTGVPVLVLPTSPAEPAPAAPGADPSLDAAPGAAAGPAAVLRAAVPQQPVLPDLVALLARESASGAAAEVVAVPVTGDGPLERVLMLGTGAGTPTDLRRAGAAASRRAKSASALALDARGLDLDATALRALVEGALLAAYTFSVDPAATPRPLQLVTVVVTDPAPLQAGLEAAVVTARATARARDLVNTPSLTKSPAWLADQASALLQGLSVRVRDERELAAEGFGGILGVGQGSSRPPRLVEAHYDGGKGYDGGGRRGRGRHVVLVGKGITFDTGGLSLKPNAGMLGMKADMGGAAAVLATLRAVADLALPVRVTVLAAVAENMPSGAAQRPGDVLTQYGGRTVEVLNTDAEGRLVLADALAYADRVLRADVVVDVATLTGAMPVALGKRHAGLFSSDDALAGRLLAASEASGERAWRMPLVEDYRPALDSATADLRNIGDPKRKLQGGSITAALFLREFTGGRPWAHLDIAGPSWADGDEDELTRGGTGYGVRLLVRWLEDLARTP